MVTVPRPLIYAVVLQRRFQKQMGRQAEHRKQAETPRFHGHLLILPLPGPALGRQGLSAKTAVSVEPAVIAMDFKPWNLFFLFLQSSSRFFQISHILRNRAFPMAERPGKACQKHGQNHSFPHRTPLFMKSSYP